MSFGLSQKPVSMFAVIKGIFFPCFVPGRCVLFICPAYNRKGNFINRDCFTGCKVEERLVGPVFSVLCWIFSAFQRISGLALNANPALRIRISGDDGFGSAMITVKSPAF